MTLIIRNVSAEDRLAWDALWQGYLAFYEHPLTSEQTELTWSRLLDEEFALKGLVAELDGTMVGIAHYCPTYSTWEPNPDLYLEDLFVDARVRGEGIGRALINSVSEIAATLGSSKIYWQTHKDNVVARRLYDSIGELSEFVTYLKKAETP
jgi:GNAT superfamily N-acetyltransferase